MGREVTREAGDQLWHVDAEFAGTLFPAQGGGLPAALRSGAGESVKLGQERRVVRMRLGDRGFYVKRYYGYRFLRGLARREWRVARWAHRAGLSTPRPVAACWEGGAYYVTADSPGARALSDVVYNEYYEAEAGEPPYPGHRPPELVRLYRHRRARSGEGAPSPRELAGMVADLLVELDQLGLRHRDLHPGNLLVVGEGKDRRLEILDLLALEQMPGRGSVFDHLVQLNHFFEPLASRCERLRVLNRLQAKGLRMTAEAARIEEATWAYRRRLYRGRDRRCLRDGKYFRRFRAGTLCGYVVADWQGRLPGRFEELVPALAIAEPVKESKRDRGGFGRVNGQWVFIKRDTEAGRREARGPWPKIVEDLLRGTRQKRAWVRGHMLLVRGIATARPLAWFDRSHGLAGRESIIVNEALDGWEPVDRVLPRVHGRRRAGMIETVAREIRRMHEAGVSNRDLKAQNVMVRHDGRRWRMALVDMEGVRRHRGRVGRGRRVQNLMRLAFSWSPANLSGTGEGLHLADRLRFLKTYFGPQMRRAITLRCRRRRAEAQVRRLRDWWRRIALALEEKARREH